MLRVRHGHTGKPNCPACAQDERRDTVLGRLRRKSIVAPDPCTVEAKKPNGIDLSSPEWKRYLVAPDVPRIKDLPKVDGKSNTTVKSEEATAILENIKRVWLEAWLRINITQHESIVSTLGRLERELKDLEEHYSNEIKEADAVQLAAKIKELLDVTREPNDGFPPISFSEVVVWSNLEDRKRTLEKQIAEKLEVLTKMEVDLNNRTVQAQDQITDAVDADRFRYGISSRDVFDALPLHRKIGAGWRYLQLRAGNGPFGRHARRAIFSSKGLTHTYETEFERERVIYEKLLAEHAHVVESARVYAPISDELSLWKDVSYYWGKSERKSAKLKDDHKALQKCFLKVRNLSGEGEEGKRTIKRRLELLVRAISEYRNIQEEKMRIMRSAEGIAVTYCIDTPRPAGQDRISEKITNVEVEARKIRQQTHSLRVARSEAQISKLAAWSASYDDVCSTLVKVHDGTESEILHRNIYLLLELVAVGKELNNGFGPGTLERLQSIILSNSLIIPVPKDLESAARAIEDIERRFNIPRRAHVFDWLADADGLPVNDRALVRWYQACFEVPDRFNGFEIPKGKEIIRWKNYMQEHSFYEFYAMVNEWIDSSRTSICGALMASRIERKLEEHVYKHVHGTSFEGSGEFGRNGAVITIREEVRVLRALRGDPSSMLYEPHLEARYGHRLKNAACMGPFEGDMAEDVRFYLYATLLATEQGHPFVRTHYLAKEGHTIPELMFLLPLNDTYALCTIYYADTLDWSTTFVTKWPILAGKSTFLAPLRASVFGSQ